MLRRKLSSTLELARRKSRLVVRGFEQTTNLDYIETFVSVLKYSIFRRICANATTEDLELYHPSRTPRTIYFGLFTKKAIGVGQH